MFAGIFWLFQLMYHKVFAQDFIDISWSFIVILNCEFSGIIGRDFSKIMQKGIQIDFLVYPHRT
jgi:hypothetical protein